jgi:hypothetical protein
MKHLEWAVAFESRDQPAVLLPDAGGSSQIANGDAEQPIC